jgi:molecular chaperone HscB
LVWPQATALLRQEVLMADPTYFELLGLPCRFALDPHEVEEKYLRRSREVHPDYHQLGSASEQRASLEMTAALNQAYSSLRDPFRRAEYLLELGGGPSAAEHREMSSAFLEEMLELRMQIEELRGAGDRSSPGLDALERQLQGRRDGLVADLASRFVELERLPLNPNPNPKDARRASVLLQLRELLNTARYIQGLLRDLRAD